MNASDLTPDLSALLASARPLSSELVRQLRDFADFLGARHAAPPAVTQARADWDDEEPAAIGVVDDDTVDLGGSALSPDEDVLNLSGILSGDSRTGVDLTRVYVELSSHSAIGIV